MPIDVMNLPPPCRSGRFCEKCRDEFGGVSFRAENAPKYPQMYGPHMECNFGLPWGHRGAAPWTDQFNAMIRRQMVESATDHIATQEKLGPGDVVKLILHRMGYHPTPNCGCEEFRVQMNEWGWRGCLRRRQEIVDWFASKAREQGLKVENNSLWPLVRAGMKDLLVRRRKSSREKS